MTYEKDEVYGTPTRRTLAYTRTGGEPTTVDFRARAIPVPREDRTMAPPEETSPYGPEAVVRAREMDYELTTRIQQESPYVAQEVVEHRVHDYRLYVGMWIVAGISAVTAFLTFGLMYLVIAGVATVFALISSPGQQYRDAD